MNDTRSVRGAVLLVEEIATIRNPTINHGNAHTGPVPAVLESDGRPYRRIGIIERRRDIAVRRDIDNCRIARQGLKSHGRYGIDRSLDQVKVGLQKTAALKDARMLLITGRHGELNNHVNP